MSDEYYIISLHELRFLSNACCPLSWKVLEWPGFSKLSWIVLDFCKNTLTCP